MKGLITIGVIITIFHTQSGYSDVSASSQKVIKISEHQRDKDLVVLKKVEISSARGGKKKSKNHGEVDTTEGSNHYQAPLLEESNSDAGQEDLEDFENSSGRPDIIEVSEVTETHSYEEQSCRQPHPEPLTTHATFAKLLLSYRIFFPMASSFFYNKISMALTGKLFDRNDPSKSCLRAIFSNNDRRYVGFDSKIVAPCKGNLLDATCDCQIGREVFAIHSTAVHSDGTGYVLLVACNSGGRGGWAVASDQRNLTNEAKQEIMTRVASFGFDTTDVLEINYSKCEYGVNPAVQEGQCKEDIPTVSPGSRDKVLHVLQQGVYTPFSSLANVYALGIFLSGSPLKGDGDEEGMCARHDWSLPGSVTSSGFNDRKSILTCDMTDITNIKCFPDDEHGDNKKIFLYHKTIRPIWTDGVKHVLVYNCLSTRIRTWALYSTTETIDKATKDFVLKKILDYGFDTKKTSTNSYAQCETLTTPNDDAN